MAEHRRPATPELRHIQDPLKAIEDSIGGANLLFLQALRHRALERALPVYLVGGPVRDLLLGAPIKDLDFVVEGEAPGLARAVADELTGELLVHRRFGTATVVLGDSRFDVVTARREAYPRPGALPEVAPGTIRDDLARRDFSINTLAIPLADQHPQIVDLHGGLDDLANGIVRILHPQSFIDDPTRILRAVRYEQRFGFRLEPDTDTRLRDALSSRMMDTVSGDRLRHELERVLEEEHPIFALRRCWELGVLAAIHPSLKGQKNPLEVLLRHIERGGATQNVGSLAYVAALAYRLTPADGEGVIHRLNLTRSWTQLIHDTIELRQRESQLAQDALMPSEIYSLAAGLSEAAVLAVSCLTQSDLVARRLVHYLDELALVRPSLSGEDLLALGVPEGPQVGRILGQLLHARLDRQVQSAEDERRLVRVLLGGKGG